MMMIDGDDDDGDDDGIEENDTLRAVKSSRYVSCCVMLSSFFRTVLGQLLSSDWTQVGLKLS